MPGHVLTPYVDATLRGVVSSGNTTSVNLGIGGVFTGTAEDTLNYSGIILSIHTDKASATNGLEMQFSPDGVTWFTSDTYTVAANACKTFSFQPVGRYARVKYTNGGVATTNFYLCLQLRVAPTKASSHRMEDDISGQDDCELVKSILAAERPGTPAVYTNIQATNGGNLKVSIEELDGLAGNVMPTVIADGANLDAFSRLRVSTPVGLFDSSFQYDLQPLIFYQVTANGGTITHTPLLASAALNTAAVANSSAIMQSKQYHRYIPAKSQLVVLTQVFGAAVANIVRRAGYFDANDGIFLEQNGTVDVALVRRTSTSGVPVDNRVAQASWNIDPLNGSGPSGLTLDLSKASILVVDLQWLGMGRVRIGFDIGGLIVYVHEFLNANVLSVPYMKTANLPIRWEASGNGVSTMYATCSSVISEGGAEFDRGFLFSHASGVITAGSGTRTPIICIRPAATYGGLTNRVQINPENISGLVTGNRPVLWEVVYNPTITGGAWVAESANSSVEYNITPVSTAGGEDIDAFWSPATANSISSISGAVAQSRLPLTLDTTGANPIVLALCATGLGGTSTVYGSISWRELR